MSRLRELAVQAWRRVEALGMDPVESIHRALVQAEAEASRVDQRWIAALDLLPHYQRQIALALLGTPGLHVADLAKATGLRRQSVSVYLVRMRSAGLIRHVAWGRWALPTFPPRRMAEGGPPRMRKWHCDPKAWQRVLRQVAALPQPVTIRAYALASQMSRTGARDRLRRLDRLGWLQRIKPGLYQVNRDAKEAAA